MILTRFAKAFSLATQLTAKQAGPLLLLYAFGTVLSINLEETIRTLGPKQETMRFTLQFTLGLWDLFEAAILFLILSWGIPKVRILSPKFNGKTIFPNGYIGNFAAEYLRMIAQVLVGVLMLVIPGIIRYARLLFVPYITLFSASYQRGEVDALELSRKLTGRQFAFIFCFFLGVAVVQLAVELTPHLVTSLYTVPIRVALLGVSFLISIWAYSFLFALFEELLETE